MASLGHETNREFNRNAFYLLEVAVNAGLSNAQVAAADTIAGLKAALVTLQATNDVDTGNLLRHAQSAVQAAADAGIIADSDILGLTTTAGLLALFSGLDSDLTTNRLITFAYSPRTGSVGP